MCTCAGTLHYTPRITFFKNLSQQFVVSNFVDNWTATCTPTGGLGSVRVTQLRTVTSWVKLDSPWCLPLLSPLSWLGVTWQHSDRRCVWVRDSVLVSLAATDILKVRPGLGEPPAQLKVTGELCLPLRLFLERANQSEVTWPAPPPIPVQLCLTTSQPTACRDSFLSLALIASHTLTNFLLTSFIISDLWFRNNTIAKVKYNFF